MAERIACFVMALISAAALAGLLGNGPLSTTVNADPWGLLHAELGRFQRNSAPTEMRLHVAQLATAGNYVEIEFQHSFLDAFKVEPTVPEPERTVARANGIILVFAIKPGDATPVWRFKLVLRSIGLTVVELGLPGREALKRTVLIYP